MAELSLDDLAVFVRVVERGGFASAARELGVPTSNISRAIARLESQSGVRRSIAPPTKRVAAWSASFPRSMRAVRRCMVYPSTKQVPARVTAFRDFVTEAFAAWSTRQQNA